MRADGDTVQQAAVRPRAPGPYSGSRMVAAFPARSRTGHSSGHVVKITMVAAAICHEQLCPVLALYSQ